jgi:hypothetical protein
MEEGTTPPRRSDALLLGGMRATRSSSMRFTERQGHTEELPVPPRRSTRSSAPPPYTPRYSAYGFIILSEEEEKKLSRIENRLVANINSTIKLSTHWVLARTYIICWGALDGCNSPTGCGKHPQRVCLGNLDDYGAYP